MSDLVVVEETGATVVVQEVSPAYIVEVVGQGPQGASGTIAVGTVTTVSPSTPASVTNSGTNASAVFNFQIPKGDTGDVTPQATAAKNAAEAAATSATSSATSASSSATSASTSATSAASSATAAAGSASSASFANNNAVQAATNANTSYINANIKAGEAATSATSASASASTATTKASEASTSATSAATSATSAATSASTATTKASEAATSASNAATSATSAAASAVTASGTLQYLLGNTEVTLYPSAGTTVLSGSYLAGYEDVYKNGAKLVRGADYTATNGTSVTLAAASTAGDVYQVVVKGGFKGDTAQNLFVQSTAPNFSGQVGIWIQTGLGVGGTGFTFWFEDGL